MSIYIYSVEFKSYVRRKEGRIDPKLSKISCNPGECVTNIQTGIKRCPLDNRVEPFDPTTETCNKRFSCTSNLTMHPVGLDGGTLQGRNCPAGLSCNCSARPLCPLDRATVLIVSEDVSNPRVLMVKNDSDKIDVPAGYRLVCDIPEELSELAFGCSLSTHKGIFDCLAGKKAGSVCPC